MNEEILIALPSLRERDRRYQAVRRRMAQEELSVLLLPANHSRWEQMMADSRYVSGIGGFGTEVFTVFPLEGPVTAYVFNRAGWWKRAQNWVQDVRDGRNRWAANAVEKLHEMGFKKGKIGISGISGLVRAPEGIVSYATVQSIRDAFPESEIVNATGLMQEIRAVKSSEEITFLERSMAIIEAMIQTMQETARPGVTERELYARMTYAMLQNGGELPTLFFLGTGPEVAQSTFVPTHRVLQAGDQIVNEIEAKYGGYAAQAVCPMVLGKARKDTAQMTELSAACFHAVLRQMRPGVSFAALFETYQHTVEREGKGEYVWSHPMLHSRGLGDDAPALMSDRDLDRLGRQELKEGMVFILKPRVRRRSGKGQATIGDTVVVEQNGARRLGRREMKLMSAA